MTLDQAKRDEVEHWFVVRGVPHFIANYSATRDVLTRATPVLTVVFLLSSISGIDLDWPTWAIVAATIGGFFLLVAVWVVLNWFRGRPLRAFPDRVGGIEIAVFLGVPSILPLIFGADFFGAVVTLLGQTLLLGVIYVATSYGVIAITRWAFGQVFRTLGRTFRLFIRGLPLLLIVFLFIFVNAEAWQSAGRLNFTLLVTVMGLFVVLSIVFLVTQISSELNDIATAFTSWTEIETLSMDSPLAGVEVTETSQPNPPKLTWREWGNVGLVMLFNQGLRIVLVSTLVGGFFVVFGLIVIRPETITLWTTEATNELFEPIWWFGQRMVLTKELLRVSAFLASFAAVYFSVYTITDPTLRSEFFEDIAAEVRENLAVRALYRYEIQE